MAASNHKEIKANAVWIALVNLMLENWPPKKSNKSKTFTYDEIARIIEAKRADEQAGASSMNYPLGAIHRAIKTFNSETGQVIPYLNALVVNKSTNLPGKGLPQNAKPSDIWTYVYSKNQRWLIELTQQLGFRNSIEHDYKITKTNKIKRVRLSISGPSVSGKKVKVPPTKIKGDLGATSKSLRSECWVIPKHFETAKAVKRYLSKNAEQIEFSGARPDFFVMFNGKRSVFEVKPNTSTQSLATGIGQLLLYGKALKAQALYLALPDAVLGGKLSKIKSLRAILKDSNICIVPLLKQTDGTYLVGKMWRISKPATIL